MLSHFAQRAAVELSRLREFPDKNRLHVKSNNVRVSDKHHGFARKMLVQGRTKRNYELRLALEFDRRNDVGARILRLDLSPTRSDRAYPQ